MNEALCRGAWDKGCTDIMYMIVKYPIYPIISLLTQPRGNRVNVLQLGNSDSTSGLEVEFSPPQLNALPLSYTAPRKSFLLYLVFLFICLTAHSLTPNDLSTNA